MSLNTDLFGNVIPEKPKSVSVTVRRSGIPELEGMRVFHGSTVATPDEFTKAPILHVGTPEQAAHIVNPDWERKMDDEDFPLYEHAEEVDNVHGLAISKHAQIHRITVPDDIANEAHVHFLREKGLTPTSSVAFTRSYHGVEHPLVKSALNALRQNKIVPYKNTWETPEGSQDTDDISYMVPAPHINLVQFGQKEPVSQPLLPMDYTGVLPKSKKTIRDELIRDMYPHASERGIQSGAYDDVK